MVQNTYYNNYMVQNGISGNLKLVSTKIILGLPVQIMSVDAAVR